MTKKLTPEQIKNWRKILAGMVGPYAFLMPDEEVQAIRDRMQARLDKMIDTDSEATANED